MEKKKKRLGYVLITPAILIMVFVLIFPLVYAFYLSFFDVKLEEPLKL